jgi:hypothetical protein
MRGRRKKEISDILNINATWRVNQDKHNYILEHKGKNEANEEGTKWVAVGFYQTVKQLYHALVEKGIKESSLTDIKALDIKIQELHTFIEDAHAKGIMSQEK